MKSSGDRTRNSPGRPPRRCCRGDFFRALIDRSPAVIFHSKLTAILPRAFAQIAAFGK